MTLPVVGIVPELVAFGGLEVIDYILAQFIDPAVEQHVAVAHGHHGLDVVLRECASEICGHLFAECGIEHEVEAVNGGMDGGFVALRVGNTLHRPAFPVAPPALDDAVHYLVEDGALACGLARLGGDTVNLVD